MSDILTKMISIATKQKLPHVVLPLEFMTDDSEPREFTGADYRKVGVDGFIDDRVRNANNFVEYAPRRMKPNMDGTGKSVHEEYPQSSAAIGWPTVVESNVPRQARGHKADTMTQAHDQQTTFDVAVATFFETGPGLDGEQSWPGSHRSDTTQPPNPFNATYPYNHVRNTESGHLFEADDTPGAERIKEAHRTGTYYEIGPDGSRVTKIVRDDFTVIVGDERVNIQGSAIITVEGDCNFYTKGNFTHQVDGDYNLLVKGIKTERVAGNTVNSYHSDYDLSVGQSIAATRLGIGKGNGGGNYRIKVGGSYQIETQGSAIEIFGDPVGFASGIIPNSSRVLVGNYAETIIGQASKFVGGTYADVVGGIRTDYTVGLHEETHIFAHETTTYGLELNTLVGGQHNILGGYQINDISGLQTNILKGAQTNTITGTQTNVITGLQTNQVTGAAWYSAGIVLINGVEVEKHVHAMTTGDDVVTLLPTPYVPPIP